MKQKRVVGFIGHKTLARAKKYRIPENRYAICVQVQPAGAVGYNGHVNYSREKENVLQINCSTFMTRFKRVARCEGLEPPTS